jgi:hypothetical protein
MWNAFAMFMLLVGVCSCQPQSGCDLISNWMIGDCMARTTNESCAEIVGCMWCRSSFFQPSCLFNPLLVEGCSSSTPVSYEIVESNSDDTYTTLKLTFSNASSCPNVSSIQRPSPLQTNTHSASADVYKTTVVVLLIIFGVLFICGTLTQIYFKRREQVRDNRYSLMR